MTDCPCSSGNDFASCCEPFLEGKAEPQTAEALMRSRYSAYAVGKVKYIGETHNPDTRHTFDEEASREWAENATWTGLSILNTEKGRENDSKGIVEFVAHFDDAQGRERTHRERSNFEKKKGRWYFIDGDVAKNTPFVRSEKKVGRNDPCMCGSGKKYKKCCG